MLRGPLCNSWYVPTNPWFCWLLLTEINHKGTPFYFWRFDVSQIFHRVKNFHDSYHIINLILLPVRISQKSWKTIMLIYLLSSFSFPWKPLPIWHNFQIILSWFTFARGWLEWGVWGGGVYMRVSFVNPPLRNTFSKKSALETLKNKIQNISGQNKKIIKCTYIKM